MDGIINATESFLRSSEVHRLFIQELVQGTFDEASDDHLRSEAMRELIEREILTLLEEKREVLTERLSARLLERAEESWIALSRPPGRVHGCGAPALQSHGIPLNSPDVSNGRCRTKEKLQKIG